MKDIKKYDGLYAVTKDGRVWTFAKAWITANGGKRKHEGFWLKMSKNGSGYLTVGLMKNNKRRTVKVHRLVAETFLKQEEGKKLVDHIDRNRINNHVTNLRWVDAKESIANQYRPKFRFCRWCGKNSKGIVTTIARGGLNSLRV